MLNCNTVWDYSGYMVEAIRSLKGLTLITVKGNNDVYK